MTLYESKASHHGAVDELDVLVEMLDGAESTPEDLEQLERLGQVARVVRSSIRNADPNLISFQALTEMEGAAGQVRTHLQNYLSDREANAGSLEAANNAIDAVLRHARAGVGLTADQEVEEARQHVQSLRVAVSESLSGVQADIESTQERIGGLKDEIEDHRTESRQALENLRAKLEEQSTTIEAQKGRLDTAIQEYQSQFSKAQESRLSEHNQLLDQLKQSGETLLEETTGRADEQRNAIHVEAEAILEYLRETKERIEKLASATGGASQAGHYKAYADTEEQKADRWRLIAVLAAAVVGIGAVIAFFQQGDVVSWAAFWAKLALTAPFAAVAAYAGREAGRHRSKSERARNMQNDILALGPYLTDVDTDTATAIKSVVALRTFGQSGRDDASLADGGESGDSPTSGDLSMRVIQLVLDTIRREGPGAGP